MWDLPGPGIEPMFPALAGGFLTTGPPGQFPSFFGKLSTVCPFPSQAPTIHIWRLQMEAP